jgi:hypothetical protein
VTKTKLPDRATDEGVEVRVLMAEISTPSFASWTLDKAREAMQLMDAVLWNRFRDPKPFGAAGAMTLADVVKAPGQFQGFESYPSYAASVVNRIQNVLDIANNDSDKRQANFKAHVQAALERANAAEISDPSAGTLVGWRTSGTGSPSAKMTFYKTVLGNDFYYW